MQPPTGNPFATRHVRPGTIPFLFPTVPASEPNNIAELITRLESNGWRGEIVGPHGSGKSTLLAELISALKASGRAVALFEQHDGQRRLASEPKLASLASGTVIIIDGYEQLGWWERKRLAWHCRRRQCGLVVTSHEPTGLPVLFQTKPDAETLARIVNQLTPEGGLLSKQDIAAAFHAHRTNLREALFALYDQHEKRHGR